MRRIQIGGTPTVTGGELPGSFRTTTKSWGRRLSYRNVAQIEKSGPLRNRLDFQYKTKPSYVDQEEKKEILHAHAFLPPVLQLGGFAQCSALVTRLYFFIFFNVRKEFGPKEQGKGGGKRKEREEKKKNSGTQDFRPRHKDKTKTSA